MRLSLVASLLLSSLLISLPAYAQQPPQRDAQAVSLLAQCSAAMGAPAPTTTVHATGQIVSANSRDPVRDLVVESKGNDRIRRDATSPQNQQSTMLNGGIGRFTHNGRRQNLAYWQAKYVRPEHFPALICGAELARPNMSISYLGTEQVGSLTAHHIKVAAVARGHARPPDVSEPLISEFHIYLDPQSLLVLKTRTFVFSPEGIANRSVWETYYADYRSTGGLLMPFHISNYAAGQKLWDINFSTVQVNAAIADSDFQ